MLRRLCIFFLIFIQFSFCYNYILEEQQPRPRRFEESKSKRLHRHKEKPRETSRYKKGRYLGYSAYDDKNSEAQINVAKFIQNPKISQDGLEPFINFDWALYQNSIQDNMPEYNPMNQEITKKQKRNKHAMTMKTEYADLGMKTTNHKLSGRNGSIKKKGMMTRLKKIPFFFRNSITSKVKGKDKKIKISRKLASTKQSPSPGFYKTEVMPNILKLNKRSCKEQLCPRCHKLFVPEVDTNCREKRFPNIIHNCRQYYLKQNTEPSKQVTNPADNAYFKIYKALEEEAENLSKEKSNIKIRAEKPNDKLALQLLELDELEKTEMKF